MAVDIFHLWLPPFAELFIYVLIVNDRVGLKSIAFSTLVKFFWKFYRIHVEKPQKSPLYQGIFAAEKFYAFKFIINFV